MNRLALCGVIAGPLFVLTFLINGALVPDYSPLRHPVSSLQLASWVQTANFIVAGTLVVAFAIGTRIGFWGSLLIGAVGIGLIGSGIFTTDPVSGYPPGSPALSEYTWHGLVHDLFAIPTFVGWPLACFVLARRFRPWFSITSGVAFIAMFLLSSAAFAQTPSLVEFGGLFQRLTVAIGFTWLTVFGAAMLVNRRDLG
ncbi:uncharacterized protein DUF998 [Lentzea atacamensis]|uniref:Uncharacterized protein DUF998 n=1 Tax=Lentzea atacamensis TaxID=531938 RepID=A0A316IAV1_9PSEU|nr:DUF998 domain-containing protein [Lentzea atacamensis]PWK90637.1 uncharacterized protein DUF998 [Lentzea atacamensis]RAS68140.1 uncharacterized protein DUF998 [Lentzea atacamensis]